MSDVLRMKSRIQLIQNRAREIYSTIKREKEDGKITSELELNHRFFHMLYDFYTKLGLPTMIVREAWGPPFSEEYNNMMQEIQNDFYHLFDEVKSLQAGYSDAFEQSEVVREGLAKKIVEYEQMLEDYGQKLRQEYNQILFRESFDNSDKYEKEFVKTTPALVSQEVGGLILSPIVSKEIEDTKIRFKEDSNGFPGNTHQVRVINGDIRFYGDTDPHWNIAEILDGNADTWFEFEKFYLEPEVRGKIQNFGLGYEEKISWVFDDYDELQLVFEVELDYAQEMNWLGLSPFLPSEKGANPAMIRAIVIHDGKGGRKTITQNESFDDNKIWMFEAQMCKKIEFILSQSSSYEVKVGHLFFKELETQAAHFLDKGKEMSGRLVSGPMPSIEMLGIRWDKQKQKIVWGEYEKGFEFENPDEKKSAIFSTPVTKSFVQADFEYIDAYRYMIGIRDLSMFHYQFETSSEYVSKPYHSPAPVWMVELEVDEYVPEEFGYRQIEVDSGEDFIANQKVDAEWIEYYISVDDGQNWHPITPKNKRSHIQGVPKMYWINTNTPKEMRLKHIGYLEEKEDVNDIRVKIQMNRPSSFSGYTPVIEEYRIKASTVNEVIV